MNSIPQNGDKETRRNNDMKRSQEIKERGECNRKSVKRESFNEISSNTRSNIMRYF